MHHPHRISPVIALRARQLRSRLNAPEQALWAALRGARLGTYFRRQVPLGNFIADFVAPRERVIVEVDGGYHTRRRAADARRDRKLARMGYRVLRLDAELVRTRIADAVALVRAALDESG